MALTSTLFTGDARLEEAASSDPGHVLIGDHGPHVGKIQRAVMELDSAAIDYSELEQNYYGPSTAAAVLAYKTKRDIVNRSYQSSADDIVGVMTIAALDREWREVKDRHIELNEVMGPPLLERWPRAVGQNFGFSK